MEDVLKILTRGNKPLRRKLESSRTAPKIPRPNPQLYHDTTPALKRKRNNDIQNLTLEDEDEELSDVDFFAPKLPEKHQEAEKATPAQVESTQDSIKRLPEDECRQIFRSHRLKITVMPTNSEDTEQVEELPRKKKKKKKQKVVEPPKAPKKQKPIYPQPLNAFAELRSVYNTSRRLLENLRKQAYKVPTEIQLGSLPLLLDPAAALAKCCSSDVTTKVGNGIHLISVAPTGSGKTMTFLVHTISHILQRRASESHKSHGLESIIVAPTRELATQIAIEGCKLAAGTGIKIVRMKKGMLVPAAQADAPMNVDEDNDAEEEGAGSSEESDKGEDDDGENEEEEKVEGKSQPITKANILVTTPMMLVGFLKGHKTLPSVRQLVLDEVDVLLDPLFLEQTMKIWDACTNTNLSVSFWSGTMSSSIETLIAEKLKSRTDTIGSISLPLFRVVVGLKDTAVPNIEHKLIYTGSEHGKIIGLRQLFRPTPGDNDAVKIKYPFIIFTQTIDRAKALYEEFRYDLPLGEDGSSRIAVLHSALSEPVRAAIMTKFRANEIWVVVSTDLLMRGIDFPNLKSVVNYDLPQSGSAYVHRAGRTGRAGRDGIAVTFWANEDVPYLKAIANVIRLSEKQAGKSVLQSAVKQSLYDKLPDVKKGDRQELKAKGVPERRPQMHSARITTKSSYDRRKENNRLGAIEGSKRRKAKATEDNGESWGGLDD